MDGAADLSPMGRGAWQIFCKFEPRLLTQLILAGITAETQTILGAETLTPDDICRLPSARRVRDWGVYADVLQTPEGDDNPIGMYSGSSVDSKGMGSHHGAQP